MTKQIVTAVFAALALAACADVPQRAAGVDLALDQCEYEATAATQTYDTSLRSAFGQALDMAMRRGELIRLCMRARGR